MTTRPDFQLDLDRGGVGLALVGEWALDTPRRQQAAADAAIAAWQHVGWPAGLLSHSCLLGGDGQTVLHYMQWADEPACREFVATDRARWTRAVDEAVPEISRRGVVAYLPPRGRSFDSTLAPGCVVVVTREFDGPDLRRARRWVDAMFDVPGGDAPLPGMISAHLHVSTDGARAINVAQWTTEDAHRALIAGQQQRLKESPRMQQVENWPGLKRTTFKRYRPYKSATAPPA
jgi:hypothetical protein